MKQLELRLPHPRKINVEGYRDAVRGITYLGDAEQQFDGTWVCLANVDGALCRVEVKLRFDQEASETLFD